MRAREFDEAKHSRSMISRFRFHTRFRTRSSGSTRDPEAAPLAKRSSAARAQNALIWTIFSPAVTSASRSVHAKSRSGAMARMAARRSASSGIGIG